MKPLYRVLSRYSNRQTDHIIGQKARMCPTRAQISCTSQNIRQHGAQCVNSPASDAVHPLGLLYKPRCRTVRRARSLWADIESARANGRLSTVVKKRSRPFREDADFCSQAAVSHENRVLGAVQQLEHDSVLSFAPGTWK